MKQKPYKLVFIIGPDLFDDERPQDTVYPFDLSVIKESQNELTEQELKAQLTKTYGEGNYLILNGDKEDISSDALRSKLHNVSEDTLYFLCAHGTPNFKNGKYNHEIAIEELDDQEYKNINTKQYIENLIEIHKSLIDAPMNLVFISCYGGAIVEDLKGNDQLNALIVGRKDYSVDGKDANAIIFDTQKTYAEHKTIPSIAYHALKSLKFEQISILLNGDVHIARYDDEEAVLDKVFNPTAVINSLDEFFKENLDEIQYENTTKYNFLNDIQGDVEQNISDALAFFALSEDLITFVKLLKTYPELYNNQRISELFQTLVEDLMYIYEGYYVPDHQFNLNLIDQLLADKQFTEKLTFNALQNIKAYQVLDHKGSSLSIAFKNWQYHDGVNKEEVIPLIRESLHYTDCFDESHCDFCAEGYNEISELDRAFEAHYC